MHCNFCGWQKGIQAKATLMSEEIKPVALSIVELCLAGGICWSDSQLVDNSVKLFFKNRNWGCSEDIFELCYA